MTRGCVFHTAFKLLVANARLLIAITENCNKSQNNVFLPAVVRRVASNVMQWGKRKISSAQLRSQ